MIETVMKYAPLLHSEGYRRNATRFVQSFREVQKNVEEGCWKFGTDDPSNNLPSHGLRLSIILLNDWNLSKKLHCFTATRQERDQLG